MKRLLGLLIVCLVAPAWAGQMEVADAWVREAPPNAPMMAGYLTLKNRGHDPAVLVGASSPQFKKVEIHRSRMENGMAHMEKQREVKIPPGGEVRFQPGGYHLMLMHPVRRLRAGDTVRLELVFADGARVRVEAPVRRDHGGMMHHH